MSGNVERSVFYVETLIPNFYRNYTYELLVYFYFNIKFQSFSFLIYIQNYLNLKSVL